MSGSISGPQGNPSPVAPSNQAVQQLSPQVLVALSARPQAPAGGAGGAPMMPPQAGGAPGQMSQGQMMQRPQMPMQGSAPPPMMAPGQGGGAPMQPGQQGMPQGQPMSPRPAMGGGTVPNGAPQGQPTPMGGMGGGRLTAAQMAQQGRFGDQVIAHVAPGETMIPPEMGKANPGLMQQIHAAFQRMGVSPAQFTAGSPASSHNPSTGAPEFSLLGALLPILGGAAGTF